MTSTDKPSITFLTTKDSPFADGYDIEGERRVLKDLIESDDPDATDPRYLRLLEFYERQAQLDQKVAEHRERGGAEPGISNQEAAAVKQLGGYKSSAQNTVTLHTKEAYRLFTGRAKNPDPTRNVPPILGARRAGAMLRALWLLSANDNPYADWALIDLHDRIVEAADKLRQTSAAMEQQMSTLRQRGLTVHIVDARDPQTVPIGFASPYAFLLVEMLAEFDYFVRLVKTLESISRIGTDESKKMIAVEVTAIRSMFDLIQRYERVLTREPLNQVVRADWLPGATREQVLRIHGLVAVLGVVPREVFTGEFAPKHARRDLRVNPETKKLLEQLPLLPALPEPGNATAVRQPAGSEAPAPTSIPESSADASPKKKGKRGGDKSASETGAPRRRTSEVTA